MMNSTFNAPVTNLQDSSQLDVDFPSRVHLVLRWDFPFRSCSSGAVRSTGAVYGAEMTATIEK